MASDTLDPAQRTRAWERLGRHEYDVVVIGGGVTGAGAALDAASRGLSVALIEAHDLANGTSSRSGKIFHGGLRYLEQLNFSLVREALVERDLMVARLCPYLVEPQPFLFPFTRPWERPYVGAGVALYDLLRLTGPRSVPGHRHLSRRGVLRELPDLRPERVRGGVQYYDVRVDDARHTLMVARTAARFGCDVVTYAPVVSVLRSDRDGAVRGVRARDAHSGAECDVAARAVINATGVWAEGVQELADEHSIAVTPAKGIHLVVPADRVDSRTGLIVKTADSVFIIRRWFGYWLLGTTDTPWREDLDAPAADEADVDYLLEHANRWLRRPLGRADIVGVFAGLRPLVSGKGDSTAALARDHTVLEGPPGMVTVVGGKYTTYRVMARDAVDHVANTVRVRGGPAAPPSATDTLPLLGAAGWESFASNRDDLVAETKLTAGWVDHLLSRYGTRTTQLLDLVADRSELGEPLEGAPGYLRAEVVYAAQHEGARHLDDVLTRRTRIEMEYPRAGLGAAPEVADLLADALGWNDARRESELAEYARLAQARLGASMGAFVGTSTAH